MKQQRINAFALGGHEGNALPCFLLDNVGKVVAFNELAENIINRNDGIVLKDKKIYVVNPQAQLKLDKLIHLLVVAHNGVLHSFPEPVDLNARGFPSNYKLIVVPLVAAHDRLSGLFGAMYVVEEGGKSLVYARMQSTWKLTDTEVKLLRHITNGGGANDYACRYGVGVNTYKFHLKNIFSKS